MITRAQRTSQALRHFHQYTIANVVAEAVVDQLEAIEVDEQQRLLSTSLALFHQCFLHLLVKAHAVGQAGQRVMVGGMFEALLGVFARTDIGL
ncbi:hypothetical protein D3C80_1836270 [compost metagenome]